MYHGERLNAWTHLAGTLLALAGGATLMVRAAQQSSVRVGVGVAVYAAALLLLYGSSTLYHSTRGARKLLWQRFDHNSIYLLIAGTYTPFCLITLHGQMGWMLLALVWGLALLGMIWEWFVKSEARLVSLAIYLAMGWSAVLAVLPLISALGRAGFGWVVAGGLVYTIGVVFYVLDTRLKHAHGVWHIFVLLGSAAHYIAIYFYVL